MAENSVVKEQLTDRMADAGATLTQRLDESGLPLSAAFWLFDSELNEWRLVFASPEIRTKGTRSVYQRIQLAIQELGPLSAAVPFSAISLLAPDSDLVRKLSSTLHTGYGLSRIRFSRNVAQGRFIEDALVYRAA